MTRGSEPGFAGYGGHCKPFVFHINEKEAAGAFEQGRDRTVFVSKGSSGYRVEKKLLEPRADAGVPLVSLL